MRNANLNITIRKNKMDKTEVIKIYFMMKDFPMLREWIFNSAYSIPDFDVTNELFNFRNVIKKYNIKSGLIAKKKI